MSRYQISIDYASWDSFTDPERDTRILEMEWENLESAKAALKRIREHHEWYQKQREYDRGARWDKKLKAPVEPEWHKGLSETTLKVVLDNGREVQFHAFWMGTFERLHGARIILPPEDGLSFEVM